MLQFRGIPYATAERVPVRRSRSSRGAACATPPSSAPGATEPVAARVDARGPRRASSEDCLFLNVSTPAARRRRPVMVWIHGGGVHRRRVGALVRRTRLAAGGDVVVVTINYRLGVLGFLHLDDLVGASSPARATTASPTRSRRSSGCATTSTSFGGDPANVTIFGESAGGMSAGTLLGTPSAAGLFSAAIPQSGACAHVCPLGGRPPRSLVGAAPPRLERRAPKRCLAPVSLNLLAAQQTLGNSCAPARGSTASRAASDAVPADRRRHRVAAPAAGGDRGRIAADVAVVVGHTAEEWNLFHLMARQAGPLTDERLERWTERIVGTEVARQAIAVYRDANPDMSNDDLWCALGTDWVFRIPAIRLAEAQSAHQESTWMYRLSFRSRRSRARWVRRTPSTSRSSSTTSTRTASTSSSADSTTGVALGHATAAWLGLATNRDPNHAGLPPWPTLRAETARRHGLRPQVQCRRRPRLVERKFWDKRRHPGLGAVSFSARRRGGPRPGRASAVTQRTDAADGCAPVAAARSSTSGQRVACRQAGRERATDASPAPVGSTTSTGYDRHSMTSRLR